MLAQAASSKVVQGLMTKGRGLHKLWTRHVEGLVYLAWTHQPYEVASFPLLKGPKVPDISGEFLHIVMINILKDNQEKISEPSIHL
jgi:hypothetical protein